MKKKLRLAVLMAMVMTMLVPLNAAVNDTFEIGDFKYEVTSEGGESDNCVKVVGLKSEPTSSIEITIPETVTNSGTEYEVTEIGKLAFAHNYFITSVTLHENCKSLGAGAFVGCNMLETINLGNVENIGAMAFMGCYRLSSVDLSSCQSIGDEAFSLCKRITTITIPEGCTRIGNHAFNNCTGITGTITIPGSCRSIGESAFAGCYDWQNPPYFTTLIINEGCEEIGKNAFSNCNALNSVTLPQSLTSIGDNAFSNCSFSEIEIPKNVTTIGMYALNGMALEKITVNRETPPVSDLAFGRQTPSNISLYFEGEALAKNYATGDWASMRHSYDSSYTNAGMTFSLPETLPENPDANMPEATLSNFSGEGTTLDIPATIRAHGYDFAVTSVKAEALSGKTEIKINTATPLTIIGSFTGSDGVTVRYPLGAREAYENSDWGSCNLRPYDFVAGTEAHVATVEVGGQVEGSVIVKIGGEEKGMVSKGSSKVFDVNGDIVISPAEGVEIESTTVKNSEGQEIHWEIIGDDRTISQTVVTSDITANFSLKKMKLITVSPLSAGKIYVDDKDVTGTSFYVKTGTKLNVRAEANSGYRLSRLKINEDIFTESTVDNYTVNGDITLTAEITLDWFVVGGMKYQVMDGGSEGNPVRVIGVAQDDKGVVIIPETVSYDEDGEGSVYEPVTYTIKEIGKDAFADMQGLTKLYINSISPLSIESESTPFAGIASTVTLRVPYGAIDAYKAEGCPWNVFNDIRSFTMDGENIVDLWRIIVNKNNESFGEFTIEQDKEDKVVTVVNNSEVPFGAALSLKVIPKVDEANGKAYATLSVKNGDTALTKEEGEGYALTVGNEDLNIDIAFALKSFQDENLKYEMIELGGDKVKVTGKVGTATTFTIPASVTSPDNNELSYAVTLIADNAFENDSEITSVVIPASILSIGAKAFSGCSKLEDIIFTGTVPPTIGEGAFSGIHKDAIIMVPIASVDKYKEALGEALASKVIGDKGVITLTHNQGGKINVYVVNGDTETLQTPADGKVLVDWGTQVKIEAVADEGYVFEWLKINDESLGNDVNTHTVRIMRYSPSTVSGQGENFGDITAEASFSVKIATSSGGGDESVIIKGSVVVSGGTQTIIVTHCDEGTESATIPEALGASGTTYIPVTSIAASAFEGCSSLKTVEIPSSITTIGRYAFKGCTSLESFKIKKTTTAMPSTSATRAAARAATDDVTVPEVDEHAFDDIVDKATLYVPEGWKEAFKADAVWSRFTNIKEYRDDENETVLAELTLTASAGGSLTVGAVTSENNTQTVKVAESSDVTVTVAPAEGYILSSLLYGGQDVTAQVSGGTLTLTSLKGENTLEAVFGVDTGIGAVYDMSKTVYVRDGSIIVDGAATGEVVIVCDAAGRVLRREVANGEPIELPMAAGKVYIVRIGKQVIKLTM